MLTAADSPIKSPHLAGVRWAGRMLADFVYPPACVLCAAPAEALPLCEKCGGALDQLTARPACGRCGYPLANEADDCPRCGGRGIAHIDRMARLGVFADPLRQMVHRMKYRGGWLLAEFFAERLWSHPPVREILRGADCLVPIPLHPLRHWGRGYNQAELIARRLAARSGVALRHPLVRLRHTRTQIHIHSQQKRWDNMRDAFGLVDAESVRARRAVLVDDVITSGATVCCAAEALAGAGLTQVSAIAVAVADPRGWAFELV
jgi:ComF family protein